MRDDDIDYADNNKLDIAFIAEDSREVRSVSISASDAESISTISKINGNHLCHSPFLNFDQDMGNMNEWAVEEVNIFSDKKMRKRKSEAIAEQIQESNEEYREIQKMSKCTKKRLGEKMKVITVGDPEVSQISNNSYSLRSKKSKSGENEQRNISPEDSSDEIRQIVNEIDGKSSMNPKAKGNAMNYNFLNNRL